MSQAESHSLPMRSNRSTATVSKARRIMGCSSNTSLKLSTLREYRRQYVSARTLAVLRPRVSRQISACSEKRDMKRGEHEHEPSLHLSYFHNLICGDDSAYSHLQSKTHRSVWFPCCPGSAHWLVHVGWSTSYVRLCPREWWSPRAETLQSEAWSARRSQSWDQRWRKVAC